MTKYHDPKSGVTVVADNSKAAATAIQTKQETEKKVTPKIVRKKDD